jgi:hypothetical protein
MEQKFYFLKWKEITKVSLVLTALFLSVVSFGQAPKNGLVLYYNFEGTSGSFEPDSSGNGNNGTIIGSSFITTGYIGSGVNFPTDATPATDYVQLPNGITGSLTDFSVSAWVKLDANKQWMRIFDFGGGTNNYMFLTSMGGNLKFAFKNGGSEEIVDGGSPLPTGKWVHVAITCAYSGGVGIGKLYMNGALVGTNNAIDITPAMLDATLGTPTSQNYIGKSQWPDPGLNGTIDEFRIYNRAVSGTEVLQIMGFPAELITQYNALDLGNLSSVTSDLTLPVTMGSNGVTVKWTSSDTTVITTSGKVTRPSQFDAPVKLIAVVKLNSDSLVKTFNANVTALKAASELIAKWDFKDQDIFMQNGEVKVKDVSGNGLVGTLKNVAQIRTYGKDTLFNVLDLGNDKGYFDMDTVIGQAIYGLKDYSVGAYFYIDSSYTQLGNNGNFLWNFSNTKDAVNDASGYIVGILKSEANKITPDHWTGEQGPIANTMAPKGSWHHFAYSQSGTTGTVFLDGVSVGSATVSITPSSALTMAGRKGTRYNWIGRSCYTGDVYLRQALVYGFELYSVQLTGDDWLQSLGVADTIKALNSAYAKGVVIPSSLVRERDSLNLGDISALTSNLTLPVKGRLDTSIVIQWTSVRPGVLDSTGVVTRPDYLNTPVTLTATLIKGTQKLTKVFNATILANTGTEYSSDLLLNYNFADSQVSGETVTDAAEKHFTGTLMNGATVKTIGSSTTFNVLNLGTDTAYFDMGTECGKVAYGLSNYTISVFFAIDSTKTNLSAGGNFIYSFANSNDANADKNGYMFGAASNVIQCISTNYWAVGNWSSNGVSAPSIGKFHHMVFTQNGTIGTVYFDGDTVASAEFPNIPCVALPKTGLVGTSFNWLGKSCYVGDAYLAKALIADFKLYKKALTGDDVKAMQGETKDLNAAIGINTAVAPVLTKDNAIVVGKTGYIQIDNIPSNAKVKVYNLMGQRIAVQNNNIIPVKSGVYLVQIDNNKVHKVIVW